MAACAGVCLKSVATKSSSTTQHITRSVSTGAPQGCVLSPLLLSLYTSDCTSGDPAVKLLKLAGDTRLEVERLVSWCSQHNLELNTLKTVEIL